MTDEMGDELAKLGRALEQKQELTLLLEVDRSRISPGAVNDILNALTGVEVLELHYENVLAEGRTKIDEQQRELLARDTGDVGLPNVDRPDDG